MSLRAWKWFHGIPVGKGSQYSGNWGHSGTPGRGGSPPKAVGGSGGYMGKLERTLGENLIVEASLDDPTVKGHLYSLAKIPTALLGKAAWENVKIYVGNVGVPGLDEAQHLKGRRPRGWPSGSTWDDVGGCGGAKKILLGKTAGGSGTAGSVAGHEFGHSVAGRRGIAGDPKNLDFQSKLYDKLPGYFQQGGRRGRAGASELAAETLSILWRHGAKAANDFASPEYVS